MTSRRTAGLIAILVFCSPLLAVDAGLLARQKIFRDNFLNHFTLGMDAPKTWHIDTRTNNGANWDCRVAYLSGAAGNDADIPWWQKYSDYPDVYIKECKEVGPNKLIPWFTFYMLAASYPAQYQPGPAQATPVNAKNAATMKSYFGYFKILMQDCAKHSPYPVVVHVEPDEWGHLLLSTNIPWPDSISRPDLVDVKVGSCGMPELAGLPDNLFGFAQAFKKLRDTYAPNNVLLITNPSGWDWQGSMTGTKFGNLMKSVCGDWDGAVFETGDRDKGMSGVNPPYTNQVSITGNFDNHINWIHDFHAASGLYVFVWQAAVGNTFFKSCDNTPGHYTDNLAQTLLENYPTNNTIDRYAKAGCLGWMFNAGQGDSTHVYDAKNDGITNPATITGNLGNVSQYSDDDGGYMRLRGGSYFANPYLLTIPTPTAPSALIASGASGTQVDLSWTDNSSDETGFTIQRSPDGTAWTDLAMVDAGVVRYSDTGLTAATTYFYRVSAFSVAGSSAPSNTASATTMSSGSGGSGGTGGTGGTGGGGGGGGGSGGSASAALTGPNDDFDGDGIVNSADPDIDNDTIPNANDIDPYTYFPLTITKLQGGANFKLQDHDLCSVSGLIPDVPAGFTPDGKVISLDIGGAQGVFTLDAKGHAKTPTSSFAMKLKLVRNKTTKAKEFLGGSVPFSAKLSKGTWSDDWADEGVSSSASAKKQSMPVSVTMRFNGKAYRGSLTTLYTATSGKSGKFSGVLKK